MNPSIQLAVISVLRFSFHLFFVASIAENRVSNVFSNPGEPMISFTYAAVKYDDTETSKFSIMIELETT